HAPIATLVFASTSLYDAAENLVLYTLSLHVALPISRTCYAASPRQPRGWRARRRVHGGRRGPRAPATPRGTRPAVRRVPDPGAARRPGRTPRGRRRRRAGRGALRRPRRRWRGRRRRCARGAA